MLFPDVSSINPKAALVRDISDFRMKFRDIQDNLVPQWQLQKNTESIYFEAIRKREHALSSSVASYRIGGRMRRIQVFIHAVCLGPIKKIV